MSGSGLHSEDSHRQYCFGVFTLDLQGGFLRRGDEEVPLRPKTFEVLQYLVARHGRLVTKAELMDAVWPDAATTENSVAQCLVEIRRALTDDSQQFIRTVARRGYIFAAPVTAPPLEFPSPVPALASARYRWWGRKRVAGAIVLILMLAGSGLAIGMLTNRHRGGLTYTQVTNFSDSAVQPAVSPDGRMVTFIRGPDTFTSQGQVYVKILPDGEPVQLTNDLSDKISPVFLPDGTRIGYGTVPGPWQWNTWTVPVLGGQPSVMLANASGTTWIQPAPGPPRILFSELTGEGSHMALATAAENRSASRRVYVPPGLGMAHRSYLSPDGHSVLLAEMDFNGWLPCRLVPYDGSSQGRPVGLAGSQCTDAAWSPDNKWMYFSTNAGGGFHIWRQHFPDGPPEQVTSGVTEEQGVAFAPDGRSFFTSIGSSQSTLSVHDASGERQITSEGYAFQPSFSADGKKLYYLLRSGGGHFVSGGLWVVDLQSGQRQRLLADFVMQQYSVSSDGNKVVFVRGDQGERSPVWVAALDGSSPPRALGSMDGVIAYFGTPGSVIFAGREGAFGFLYRIREDGGGLEKLASSPILYLYGISPDQKWIAAWVPGSTPETRNSVVAIPVQAGAPVMICSDCGGAGAQRRGHTPPVVSWSQDQKFFYLNVRPRFALYAIPLRGGHALPPVPASGIRSVTDVEAIPGARLVSEEAAFSGPNPSIYAFTKVSTQRNIYRVGLP